MMYSEKIKKSPRSIDICKPVIFRVMLFCLLHAGSPPLWGQQSDCEEYSFEQTVSPDDYPQDEKGYHLLLEGPGLYGWRNRGSEYVSPIWKLEKRILHYDHDEYGIRLDLLFNYKIKGDFELELEYKTDKEDGVAAICYFVRDIPGVNLFKSSLLMSIGSNSREGKPGSLLHIIPARADYSLPAGKWNKASVRVEKGRVLHKLNDRTVVEYSLERSEWSRALLASPYSETKDARAYGMLSQIAGQEGYIGLKLPDASFYIRNIRLKIF
jgi:hypothetical protein